MAESCLPCLCSSCACSTRYHFVPPSLTTFNKLFCIFLGAYNAVSSPAFRCQGNHHPRRHPLTAQGEGGGSRKEGSKMQLWPRPLSRVHQTSGPSPTHCSDSDTHKENTQSNSAFDLYTQATHACTKRHKQEQVKEMDRK